MASINIQAAQSVLTYSVTITATETEMQQLDQGLDILVNQFGGQVPPDHMVKQLQAVLSNALGQ
jgi:hypothetical protein